ncbi:MAG: hypothetical protein V2I43_15090 [Parvularcula sp.]|jgi:hypothetical protein|nr:hypothetical protein [Parvularcula sp.]
MTDDMAIREAQTTPSKAFFVSMLTRDIDLQDAILDLLDNCIDGAVRSGPKPEAPAGKEYFGYSAELSFSKEEFSLVDNCGGIPIGAARERAFRLGRPPSAHASPGDGKTVGVYGIGMKRAIFKLGRNASVTSNGDDPFRVDIGPRWLDSDDWRPLTLEDHTPGPDEPSGTKIVVADLIPSIAEDISSVDWVERFRRYLADHYALIIDKGFTVRIRASGVSSDPVRPAAFALAATGDLGSGGVQPFIYRGDIEGVRVEVYAGLLRKPLTQEEIAEVEGQHSEKSAAGWTIACNDRVVVSRDRTHITGWGTASVPSYHGQYSVIAGMALMYSDDVKSLPLTTTKRGLDGSSSVYAKILDIMRQATKRLTSFTNDYKTEEARRELLSEAPPRSLAELRSYDDLRLVDSGRLKGMQVLTPELPKPTATKRTPRISFSAEQSEIDAIRAFFEDDSLSNNDLGRAAFDHALEAAGFGKK